jgi:hypothetical protein
MPRASLHWDVPVELSKVDRLVCKRLKNTGRLFVFLREHRHELFDEAFEAELSKMYSDKPRGTAPKPPAMLAMVTLLQAYERKSDAAAVEEAVFDRRWQMVLNCYGCETPPFSQGLLVEFRRRLMAHDMDRRLVERTVELARTTGAFSDKALRVALDSAPLWGAGRVEDTFNLIGHTLGLVVQATALVLKLPPEEVQHKAGLTLLQGDSLKADLDIDWDDATAQAQALQRVVTDVHRLQKWVNQNVPNGLGYPQLKQAMELLARVIEQDLEPDPDGGGYRVKQGTARDRRISVTDADMRHGRKSKSRVINGFKRHIARDLDSGVILAVTVRPANEPEQAAAAFIRPDVEVFGQVAELHIDRGYLASPWTRELYDTGKRILAKPWNPRNGDRFSKREFKIDLERGLVVCPEQNIAPIRGTTAKFSKAECSACPSRERCTTAERRSISIHEQEAMLVELRTLKSTSDGRAVLRQRVGVEHMLAHVARRQGPKARYRGIRLNVLDLRRVAAVENLHVIDRMRRAA